MCTDVATLFEQGELTAAKEYLEQGRVLYNPQQHDTHVSRFGQDFGVWCVSCDAWLLWTLGYVDQALQRSQDAVALARDLSHSADLASALDTAGWIHLYRREWQPAQEHAEATIALCTEQGFAIPLAWAIFLRARPRSWS